MRNNQYSGLKQGRTAPMYLLLILGFSFFFSNHSKAQADIPLDLISSLGAEIRNDEIILQVSIGEPIIGFSESDQMSLNEGFLQTNIWSESVSNGNLSIENISVFPNPSNDFVFVNLDHKKNLLIEITDLMGKEYLSFTSSSDNISIPVSQLPNGTYILSCRTSDGSYFITKIQKI